MRALLVACLCWGASAAALWHGPANAGHAAFVLGLSAVGGFACGWALRAEGERMRREDRCPPEPPGAAP